MAANTNVLLTVLLEDNMFTKFIYRGGMHIYWCVNNKTYKSSDVYSKAVFIATIAPYFMPTNK